MAEAESSPDRASPRFQSTGRWTEVKIYRTAGGKWVAHIVHRTAWQGERDRHDAEVFATPKELYDHLLREVPSWLAEEVAEEAGLLEEAAEEVE